MPKNPNPKGHQGTFLRLEEVRTQALEHTRLAQRFHQERRGIINGLIDAGLSQADFAREIGVSRQAIQKMLSV